VAASSSVTLRDPRLCRRSAATQLPAVDGGDRE
jgi:hypothetical protein